MRNPTMQNLNDVFIGIAFLILSALLFWASLDVKDFSSVGVGASFMPRLIAGLFLIISLPLIIKGSRSTLQQGRTEPIISEHAVQTKVFGGLPGVAISILLMYGYMLAIQSIGFIISSSIYVFLQTLVLTKDSEKRYILFLLTSILPTIATYYFFVDVFGISLPAGVLP